MAERWSVRELADAADVPPVANATADFPVSILMQRQPCCCLVNSRLRTFVVQYQPLSRSSDKEIEP